MGHRIAQAATSSGVPATAIRWYEDQGVLPSPGRATNGYRSYDDRDLERLRFVGRLRTLDLPTDDIAALVRLWDGDECAWVADELRGRLDTRLVDVQQRIFALLALSNDLQAVLARLEAPPHDGPCVPGACPCLSDGAPPGTHLPVMDGDRGDTVTCTLARDRMPDRLGDWQALLVRARGREQVAGGVSVQFPMDLDLSRELVRLASAEQDCCRFFQFSLDVTADALRLQVTGPPAAQPVIAAVFGPPADPVPPGAGSAEAPA